MEPKKLQLKPHFCKICSVTNCTLRWFACIIGYFHQNNQCELGSIFSICNKPEQA